MAVILEFDFARRSQSDGAFAAGIIGKELVGGAEVAGLSRSVVVVACNQDPVAEGKDLAPAAFEVLCPPYLTLPVLTTLSL